ncbi:chromosomal replication initiator protein DnaA [Stackebrandtia nassauensis]|uniref:Chromosomal replication initiator protein DnaA n=1 Tax=Stackebrandtia nassauensis (strain DSM 44728 / CIP 108903 / NRRL B-16338 / NBRC 102104 / LLR-40K-21) TaxID=446470 RepID=D3PTW6_STANL|nr:chromosomal replication initiator protein DnaA [Stackebrandtia nassauensis DSM 44728]
MTAELGDESLSGQQRAWLAVTQPLGLFEDTVIIAAPHQFAREAFESRLRPMLTEALARRLGRAVQIAVTVRAAETPPPPAPAHPPVPAPPALPPLTGPSRPQPEPQPQPEEQPTQQRLYRAHTENMRAENSGHIPSQATPPAEDPRSAPATPPALFDTSALSPPQSPNPRPRPTPTSPHSSPQPPVPRPSGPLVSPPPASDPAPERTGFRSDPKPVPPQPATATRLNPKYSFDTFVIGSSNRFAHAAAVAVAESPAKAYNPLFIYGDSGLGKTHLLHAIGHYAQNLGNAKSVRYVSTEEFTNDFINSLRDDKRQAFQRRYRDVDILLIDDIQFLERAERTQEEFFHTFNTLHNANKQLVITSDRSPKQLSTLEDRLRTRFEWGLLADIQPPDLETRIAILQKKAAQERLDAPPDALEFIASRINHSIRELEGALIRVTAYASLTNKPADLALAQEVLRDFIPEGESPDITTEAIMHATADYFGVSDADLRGHSRSRVLANARQVAMYLCRELTELSLPRIGQAFGGRDHTTVMYADRKIRKQMAEKRALYDQIAELTNRLKNQSGS